MHVQRRQLVQLLRSRNSDTTARRAEQTLPQHIDLDRDRDLLKQCGIDPNVLAFILSVGDRVGLPTQPLQGDDEAGGGHAPADDPRTSPAQHWPCERGTRRPSETAAATSTGWFRRRFSATPLGRTW